MSDGSVRLPPPLVPSPWERPGRRSDAATLAEYRQAWREIDELPADAGDDALARLLEQAAAVENRIYAKPAATTGDLLLRAEIALRYDIMAALEDPEADHAERACAELIRAVVDVLGPLDGRREAC